MNAIETMMNGVIFLTTNKAVCPICGETDIRNAVSSCSRFEQTVCIKHCSGCWHHSTELSFVNCRGYILKKRIAENIITPIPAGSYVIIPPRGPARTVSVSLIDIYYELVGFPGTVENRTYLHNDIVVKSCENGQTNARAAEICNLPVGSIRGTAILYIGTPDGITGMMSSAAEIITAELNRR